MDRDRRQTDRNASAAADMLRRVLQGATYDRVAADFGITRTAVERRVKALAARLQRAGSLPGVGEGSIAFVNRLRAAREPILEALDKALPPAQPPSKDRVLSEEEILLGAQQIRRRSANPWRDVALFYLLFATGARPLEVARLRVRDYLAPDGDVRRQSELSAEASLTACARPLFFASARLDEALAHYLGERVERRHGLGAAGSYRGLDPASRLFLTSTGEAFEIKVLNDGRHLLCRPILETYRKLFRYARLEGMSALSARRTVAVRLVARGAEVDQVRLLLGISERRAVHALLVPVRRDLTDLVRDLA